MTENSILVDILSQRFDGVTSLFIKNWKIEIDIGILSHEQGV